MQSSDIIAERVSEEAHARLSLRRVFYERRIPSMQSIKLQNARRANRIKTILMSMSKPWRAPSQPRLGNVVERKLKVFLSIEEPSPEQLTRSYCLFFRCTTPQQN
jgi:hypothetical protein